MPPVKLQVVMSVPGKDPREFVYEFDQDQISIGRDQQNDIQVPLSTVSRAHCLITSDNREWYLEDLKSTHGTRHNGKPVGSGGKKLLRDGDSIDLVHFSIKFHVEKQRSQDYSVEKTEALARKMVEEVLASFGKDESQAPYLRVMNGPEEGKDLVIGPEVSEATIGRGSDCDFQINDGNVSRRHAVIRRDWNEITIEDAASKNGVVVNERRITRATALRDADEIMLGAMKLTFIDPSAKFLGKLDDIPAFHEDPDPSDASSQEGDAGNSSEGEDEGGDSEEQQDSGDSYDEDAPGIRAARQDGEGDDDGPAGAADDDARPGTAARDLGRAGRAPLDPEAMEPDPFLESAVEPPVRALGTVEFALIILAVLAAGGLAAGTAFLFMQ